MRKRKLHLPLKVRDFDFLQIEKEKTGRTTFQTEKAKGTGHPVMSLMDLTVSVSRVSYDNDEDDDSDADVPRPHPDPCCHFPGSRYI